MRDQTHIDSSVEPDFDSMDSKPAKLAERYKSIGMTLHLAERLVADGLAQGFDSVAGGILSDAPVELVDAWRMQSFRVWQSSTPRLSVGAFLMSLGWLPPGIRSQRDLAKHFKVSVEHVSNLVEEWQELLNLPRTAYQKSAKAVDAARLHHKKNNKPHAPKE